MDIGADGKEGQTRQRQARQGQRQRQARTATPALTGQRQEQGLNVGIVENVDTTRKTVGAR